MRLIVDPLPGVVAEPRRHLAEGADRQVHLVQAERGPVHEVGPVPAQAAVLRDLRDRRHAGVRIFITEMAQVHERRRRLELDGEGERVAERPVGVGEAPVERVMGVPGGGRDHAAVAGEDLHLGHRLVRHSAAQRAGLDAQAGDRAAERDRLQLRHDQRHQAVPQGGVGEVLVGRHAADDRRARRRVDAQHAPERRHVEAGRGAAAAEPEQVRRPLGQPDRAAGRNRRVGAPQQGHRSPVGPEPVARRGRSPGRAGISRASGVRHATLPEFARTQASRRECTPEGVMGKVHAELDERQVSLSPASRVTKVACATS